MARLSFCLTAWLLGSAVAAAAEPSTARKQVDFLRDIRPIFEKNCTSCHGAEKQRAGLRLDRKALALAGGDSGPLLKPGHSAESLLIERVTATEPDRVMPPRGDRLSAADVRLIRAWIDQGAIWPDETTEATVVSSHWSFQPLRRPDLPPVAATQWVRNPIDLFVLARLEAEGIAPSQEADRTTLIRRLYLDLTGLPPTPDELDQARNDESKDWYEKLVERLLDSPHFGERWGQHWLDLARYADSDGYGPDRARPNAWRWRDWVIDAINRDLPFDQFTIEQLAGDLLPGATIEQRIATGFHRHSLHNREAGTDQEEDRNKRLVDRVTTTGTVWLGLTLGCTECHSHKYDPISQREFYQLLAFFNNTDEIEAPVPPTPYDEAVAAEAEAMFARDRKEIEGRLNRRKEQLRKQVEGKPDAEALLKKRLAADPDIKKITKELNDLMQRAETANKATAMTLAAATKPRPTHIHIRGDFLQKGAEVQPGVLQVLGDFQPRGSSPDRLDLARWLVDPSNPLTPRVAVNHVWLHLFGRGLVPTVEDFGTQGDPPSHPELLDWLADEFQRLKWSRKALIRRIVTSATYRQSSHHRPELFQRDPKNDLLARQNRFRLDAQAIRDQYLAASGLLNRQVGGPSFRPPMPPSVRQVAFRLDDFYKPDKGDVLYRRGMYIFLKRGLIYPTLATFDAPDTTESCPRRPRSNTPLQALTLLNEPLFVEAAQALGRRILAEEPGDASQRIRHAFKLCLARSPDEVEQESLERLHRDLVEIYKADPAAAKKLIGPKPAPGNPAEVAAWVGVARTILNLDELVTRE